MFKLFKSFVPNLRLEKFYEEYLHLYRDINIKILNSFLIPNFWIDIENIHEYHFREIQVHILLHILYTNLRFNYIRFRKHLFKISKHIINIINHLIQYCLSSIIKRSTIIPRTSNPFQHFTKENLFQLALPIAPSNNHINKKEKNIPAITPRPRYNTPNTLQFAFQSRSKFPSQLIDTDTHDSLSSNKSSTCL